MTRLVVATRNAGKLRELLPMLAAAGFEAVGLGDVGVAPSPEEDAVEAFDTFEANALAKARYFARRTGVPCIADDSGLCVDVLDGAPGVRSRRVARDAGIVTTSSAAEDLANAEVVLALCAKSDEVPPWPAQFRCAAAFSDGVREFVALGVVEGALRAARAGAGGFGYDPWFESRDLGMTFAEASDAAKARVSHRARAVAALLDQVRAGAG